MSDALSRIWGERTERERAVIASALILLALALAYAYAWLPVTRERAELTEDFAGTTRPAERLDPRAV